MKIRKQIDIEVEEVDILKVEALFTRRSVKTLIEIMITDACYLLRAEQEDRKQIHQKKKSKSSQS